MNGEVTPPPHASDDSKVYSLRAAARSFHFKERWLRRLVADGILSAQKRGRQYEIREDNLATILKSPEFERYFKRSSAQARAPYVPHALRAYHRFHRTLNEFTWLIKVSYSARADLKGKRFRLDELFQRYIIDNHINTNSVAKTLVTAPHNSKSWQRLCAQSLKKVWYNELAFHTPALTDPFTLDSRGVQVNRAASELRLLFPSWRIVTAYYAIYHVHRALCDILGTTYRAQEHESPLRAFKATKLEPSIDVLLFFRRCPPEC